MLFVKKYKAYILIKINVFQNVGMELKKMMNNVMMQILLIKMDVQKIVKLKKIGIALNKSIQLVLAIN